MISSLHIIFHSSNISPSLMLLHRRGLISSSASRTLTGTVPKSILKMRKVKLIPIHEAKDKGFDLASSKLVTFIRHAEGLHNRDEREIKNFVSDKIYMHPRYKDADLTDHGRKQSEALADEHYHRHYHKEHDTALQAGSFDLTIHGHKKKVDLVAVSPLTRTLRTASIAFKHHLDNVKFIATELARERIAHYPTDERRHIEELKKEFPHVDFSLVETNHDAQWTERKEIHPDPYDSHLCYQRGLELLEWVHERQENHVAVVSHWVFLQHLFKVMEVNLDKPIGNAEVRRYLISSQNDLGKVNIAMSTQPSSKYKNNKVNHTLTHIPVMEKEIVKMVLENAKGKQDFVFVDGTLGLGGHSRKIIETLPMNILANYVGGDRDPKALEIAIPKVEEAIKSYQSNAKYEFQMKTFDEVFELLPKESVDIGLVDLGVSSLQLDDPDRGFSFYKDGPLDMRMNQNESSSVSAYDIVNAYPEHKLAWIFEHYGEEPNYRAVARKIILSRKAKPIKTTKELVKVIESVCQKKQGGSHPATRAFQGLRIAVNQELQLLEKMIPFAIGSLKKGGKMLFLSFHPIEDRIILRHQLKYQESLSDHKVKKPEVLFPTREEIQQNPRSRSAHMRVIEKM